MMKSRQYADEVEVKVEGEVEVQELEKQSR